jgi:hypothetical protein
MKRNQDNPQNNATISQPRGTGATERQCLHCGSWAVYPLGLIYASSTPTLAAMSPYGVATPSLPLWITAHAFPPEKMTTWTAYTLSLLLWPACLFLLGTALHGWWAKGAVGDESPAIYLTAGLVGFVAWSIPAFLRRREANAHNAEIWEPAMRKWQKSHMCLKCGRL